VKVETHVAIGRAISRYLHLCPSLEECLVRGLKKPDLNAGQRGRRIRRHHGIYPGDIMDIIWSARRAYLAGDFEKALETLGVALHYVQDNCVVGTGGRFRRIHDRVEREIASLKVPVDAIREGFKKAECSPLFVRTALYSIKPSTDPVEALRNACLYSATIAGAGYNPPQPPRGVLEILVRIKTESEESEKGEEDCADLNSATSNRFSSNTYPITNLSNPPSPPPNPTLSSPNSQSRPQFEQLAWYGLV